MKLHNSKRKISHSKNIATWFLAHCLLVYLIFSSSLFAQTQILRLEWGEVKGANGYAVELRQPGATDAKELRSNVNRIQMELAVGAYEVRVGALNKFGRAAAWSDWKRISITVQSSPTTVDLSCTTPAPIPIPAEERTPTSDRMPIWHIFVPGLAQMETGNPERAYGYWGLLGIFAYGFAKERSRGLAILGDPLSDPTNVGTLISIGPPIAAGYLQDRFNSNRDLYESHRRNQKIAGIGFGLFYLISVMDSLLFTKMPPSRATLAPIDFHIAWTTDRFSGRSGMVYQLEYTGQF